jgi:methylated-DNA-[protein]-cysteine S-methyltransferase
MNGSGGAVFFPTPFAVLGVHSDGQRLTGIRYLPLRTPTSAPCDAVTARFARELERYLDDPSFRFTVPYGFDAGSNFDRAVWQEIAGIAAGVTLTYGELARRVKSAPRPVGGACGRNPVPLVVPCHRVLAATGLGGFMGGRRTFPISVKRWLLGHEGILDRSH